MRNYIEITAIDDEHRRFVTASTSPAVLDEPRTMEVRHTLEEHGAIRCGVVPVGATGQPAGPVRWLYQCGELLEVGEGFP